MQDNLTFIFEPQKLEELYWFWGGLLTSIAAGGASIALLIRPRINGNLKKTNLHLVAMLCFFIALSGAGAVIFSGAQLLRLQPLKLDATGFSIRKQSVEWGDITEIRIEQSQQKNALNMPTHNNRILLIKAANGRFFFFAEENYPLPEIIARIKSFREKSTPPPR
jgi:hypothetical protein